MRTANEDGATTGAGPATAGYGAGEGRAAWGAALAAAVGLLASFGSIAVYSFTVFLKHLSDEFGWSRSEVSFAFTAACLAALTSILVVGRLVDRIGGRPVAIGATALFGVGFASLSFLTPHLWHLYAVFLFLGLVGAGTSAVRYSSVVSQSFDKRRGLALGIVMIGTGLGAAAAPAIAQQLVDGIGWRSAYLTFGAFVLLVACPVLLVWFRGRTRVAARATHDGAEILPGMTAREARATSTFWILVAAIFIAAAAVQGCLIHLVPLLTDDGLSAERAAFAASLFGAANLLGRLGAGYLLDRFHAPHVVVASFLGAGVGAALLMVGSEWALPATLLMGLGFGAETDAVPYLISRYFGLKAFGEIYGYAFATVPLGGAIGPLLVGLAFDKTGGYTLPLVVCSAAFVAAALLMTRLGSYDTTAFAADAAPARMGGLATEDSALR
jgi:MFS family permease